MLIILANINPLGLWFCASCIAVSFSEHSFRSSFNCLNHCDPLPYTIRNVRNNIPDMKRRKTPRKLVRVSPWQMGQRTGSKTSSNSFTTVATYFNSIQEHFAKATPHNCLHTSCLQIIPAYFTKILGHTQSMPCGFCFLCRKIGRRNPRTAIMRCCPKQFHNVMTMN